MRKSTGYLIVFIGFIICALMYLDESGKSASNHSKHEENEYLPLPSPPFLSEKSERELLQLYAKSNNAERDVIEGAFSDHTFYRAVFESDKKSDAQSVLLEKHKIDSFIAEPNTPPHYTTSKIDEFKLDLEPEDGLLLYMNMINDGIVRRYADIPLNLKGKYFLFRDMEVKVGSWRRYPTSLLFPVPMLTDKDDKGGYAFCLRLIYTYNEESLLSTSVTKAFDIEKPVNIVFKPTELSSEHASQRDSDNYCQAILKGVGFISQLNI